MKARNRKARNQTGQKATKQTNQMATKCVSKKGVNLRMPGAKERREQKPQQNAIK